MYRDTGIIFISPIIGITASLISIFDSLKNDGVDIEGVDIFENQNVSKGLLTILGLTFLPGNNARRIAFANRYNEHRLFEIISSKLDHLISRGKKKILIGGMSGGFIFAARMAQISPDSDIAPYALKARPFIRGVFGISPLIFYPKGVNQKGADLELIPPNLPTVLIWGDADTIIPEGTIAYSQNIAQQRKHIKNRIIRGSDVGLKDGTIRHQFFGGRDFVKPLKNIFWNASAERIALEEIRALVKSIQ